MRADVESCLAHCTTCQRDRPPPPAREELRWTERGGAPFLTWSLDCAGPFPPDEDGNRYLIVAVNDFSKWVEVRPV